MISEKLFSVCYLTFKISYARGWSGRADYGVGSNAHCRWFDSRPRAVSLFGHVITVGREVANPPNRVLN